jgi:Rrf2 family protein
MMLSQASKYALRAAIYLAQRPEGNHLSRDIAADLAVPAQYLAKILQDLVRAGLLTSAKGRGGGFRLAADGSGVDLLRVVRAIEGEDYGAGCALGLPSCSDTDPCALHGAWKQMRAAFMASLEGTALTEVKTADRAPADHFPANDWM